MIPKQVEQATELLQRHANLMAARDYLALRQGLTEIPMVVGQRRGADGNFEDKGARFSVDLPDLVDLVAASIATVEKHLRELGVQP